MKSITLLESDFLVLLSDNTNYNIKKLHVLIFLSTKKYIISQVNYMKSHEPNHSAMSNYICVNDDDYLLGISPKKMLHENCLKWF